MNNTNHTSQEVLLDALPYVDRQLDEEGVRESVEKMIEDELKTFSFEERDRLPVFSDKALAPSKEGAVWKATLDSMTDSKQKLNALDTLRYRMPTEPDDNDNDVDLATWQALCASTETQLQHQHLRLCNLELLQKFGGNAWRLHNYQVEGQVDAMKRTLEAEKAKVVTVINSLDAGEKLRKLEEQWQTLIGQNAH
ncbi:Pre-mRNA-splicing factor SPF27 [Syncephalis fuscata]|nr:Pre-mRNA-splicing factor SPF27 [Syncephalis fuscata]